MEDCQWPAQISSDMHGTPGGRPVSGELASGDAGEDDQQHQVRGESAEAEIKCPAAREERHNRVNRARAMCQYFQQHVGCEEARCGQ
jgi:hypothetical protein